MAGICNKSGQVMSKSSSYLGIRHWLDTRLGMLSSTHYYWTVVHIQQLHAYLPQQSISPYTARLWVATPASAVRMSGPGAT